MLHSSHSQKDQGPVLGPVAFWSAARCPSAVVFVDSAMGVGQQGDELRDEIQNFVQLYTCASSVSRWVTCMRAFAGTILGDG